MTGTPPAPPARRAGGARVALDSPDPQQGLAKLVLTVVELLRQLMERQAVRRMEHGDLDPEQLERLGDGLQALEQQMGWLCDQFGLRVEDLNLDLGPLGPLLPREPASYPVDHPPPR